MFQGRPRDPPVLKRLRKVNFGTGSKFGRDVAKRYGEGSEVLAFLGKRGRKTVRILKNYGDPKESFEAIFFRNNLARPKITSGAKNNLKSLF